MPIWLRWLARLPRPWTMIPMLDWHLEVSSEVSPTTTARAALEAAAANCLVIIAPSARVAMQEGIDGHGKSLGTVGINLLKMQGRIGKLEHPLVHFKSSGSSTPTGGRQTRTPSPEASSVPKGSPRGPRPGGGAPAGRPAAAPVEDAELIDHLRERQPSPVTWDRETLGP